jgi:hypothetical protein
VPCWTTADAASSPRPPHRLHLFRRTEATAILLLLLPPPLPGASRQPLKAARAARVAARKSKANNRPSHLLLLSYPVSSTPSLYGYAAVIFKHPIFHPYRNQLAKLVISSSLIHQLGFTMFSSMPFAIGMVQDAGLVFLSAMSGTIADRVLLHRHHHHKNGSSDDDIYDHDGTNEYDENDAAIVLSTTLVLLSLGTAILGLILMVLGKFRLANAVSFLPFGTFTTSRRIVAGLID